MTTRCSRGNANPNIMNTSLRCLAFVLGTSLCVLTHAGTIAQGSWTPLSCGEKPLAPSLNLSDIDAYNKSVAAVNAYRQALRVYIDCLTNEANADIKAITRSAAATQQEAVAANAKILADVKAADEKFK